MLKVAALVGTIVVLGVAANFSAIKTPNDGVYYVAAARALVETGAHVDATQVPPGPPITRQNGIVYALAAMIAVAGDGWPVLYALTVAALWMGAVVAAARFFGRLRGAAVGVQPGPTDWVLALCTFFQYDLVNDATSFMNEGIYVPALFILAAYAGRRLIGVRTSEHLRSSFATVPRSFVLGGTLFVVTGLFFRNQHVVLLPLVALALAISRRPVMAAALPIAAVAAFAWYASWLPAPVTDAYLETLVGLESLDQSDISYSLAMFTGPLWLTKVLSYDHPFVVLAGLAAAAAVVVGLLRMRRDHPWLAAAIALYLAGTLAFLALLPFVSTRYFSLAQLPIVVTWSVLLPNRVRVWRLVTVAATIVALVMGIYARSYVTGEKREQAYPQLVAHQRAESVIGPALVYSSQPRMVTWVLGMPACAAPPLECDIARGRQGSSGATMGPPLVFIGRGDELEGQDGLVGYAITRALTEPVQGYAAWQVAKAVP